ncbi:PUA-like domain-containing protein [Plectosphaerella plurivora]|nr:PUA-like domain-containing protein [Plectosphaerella plurivora]
MANMATSIARDKLLSLGTCIGKLTKTGKFRLHITALDVIAPYARYKLWLKPNGIMPFLYGSHIVKAHVGKWQEDCPEHSGVVVCNMDGQPLGFGISARSTSEARRLDPTGIVCFRQADCGEYVRDEDTLFASG